MNSFIFKNYHPSTSPPAVNNECSLNVDILRNSQTIYQVPTRQFQAHMHWQNPIHWWHRAALPNCFLSSSMYYLNMSFCLFSEDELVFVQQLIEYPAQRVLARSHGVIKSQERFSRNATWNLIATGTVIYLNSSCCIINSSIIFCLDECQKAGGWR